MLKSGEEGEGGSRAFSWERRPLTAHHTYHELVDETGWGTTGGFRHTSDFSFVEPRWLGGDSRQLSLKRLCESLEMRGGTVDNPKLDDAAVSILRHGSGEGRGKVEKEEKEGETCVRRHAWTLRERGSKAGDEADELHDLLEETGYLHSWSSGKP